MNEIISSSFRDPSGFVFIKDGLIYRQINHIYKDNYDHLMNSGLYKKLTEETLLIPHREINSGEEDYYKIIEPERIEFISYPYEWSFSQLKDAALLTLEIEKTAFEYGMTLKDGSVYNIQFKDGKPLMIDTLSFEKYTEGKPWVAYRQFCQHFLAPLVLMSHKDIRLGQLMRCYIDGIPLDLAGSLLSSFTYLNFPLLTHIHLHGRSIKYYSDKKDNKSKDVKISKMSFLGLIDNLEEGIKNLKWHPAGTEWADYYDNTNYTSEAFKNKEIIIKDFLDKIQVSNIWDLGANTGIFSRIAAERGIKTIAFDIDPGAVEQNYLEIRKNNEKNILPLLMDLTNPSPDTGWENDERKSLLKRGPADGVFALALIHHLAISNNVPMKKIASFFHKICKYLIIEFIPKEDSQVRRLLSSREDIFDNYHKEGFEESFSLYFNIIGISKIKGSERIMYLMEKNK